MIVVVLGDPIAGITLHGPFAYLEDAGDWAERTHPNETWWLVTVESPATD